MPSSSPTYADSDEWLEWYELTPLQRWEQSMQLWTQYLAKGEALFPNPIHKVLSTFQSYGVRALLMGGQAGVFYGGAEFSRDTDFAVLADEDNLSTLSSAIDQIQTQVTTPLAGLTPRKWHEACRLELRQNR